MHLQYMKQETMDNLLMNYDEYKAHYEKKDREWFSKHFTENNSLMEYAKDFPEFTMDKSENFNASDLKNIQIMYDALKDLPLSVACDARLWTGLAHTSLWDYVWYRQHEEIEKRRSRRTKREDSKSLFCVGNGKRRSLFVNCLSRLWWTGYLVYDENRKNPYELAETLMYGQKGHSFASQIVLLSSRNFISNKHLSMAFCKRSLISNGQAMKSIVWYSKRYSRISIISVRQRCWISCLKKKSGKWRRNSWISMSGMQQRPPHRRKSRRT